MTPKEQELRKAILSVLRSPNTLRSLTIADDIIAKARECYAQELQAERMVTFKLSQQIESLEKENKDLSDKVTNWRESWTHMNSAIERKNAALRRALERLEQTPDLHEPTIREIKEALK